MSAPSEDPPKSDLPPTSNGSTLTDKNGWDGKLRVGEKAEVVNAEILSDPDYSDEDAPPVEQIQADEGWTSSLLIRSSLLIQASQIFLKTMKTTQTYVLGLSLVREPEPDSRRKSTSSTLALPPFLLSDSIASPISRFVCFGQPFVHMLTMALCRDSVSARTKYPVSSSQAISVHSCKSWICTIT